MKRISKSGIFLVFALVAVLVCGAAFAAEPAQEGEEIIKDLTQLKALYEQQVQHPKYNPDVPLEERIAGAIMGAFIGDALGVGCHWYYDYEQLWDDYGPWVSGYVDPKKEKTNASWSSVANHRYAQGVRAGWNSQSGELLQVMLESVAENCKNNPGEDYKENYIAHMDRFFDDLSSKAQFTKDINPDSGLNMPTQVMRGINAYSGRYTDDIVRRNFDDWYNGGKKNGKWWTVGHTASTSEGAQWGVVLAALYRDPEVLFYKAYDFLSMWYSDKSYISTQLVYILTVQALINGVPLSDFADYFLKVQLKLNQTNKMLVSHDDIAFHGNTMLKLMEREHLFKPVDPRADSRFATLVFGQDCHVQNLVRGAYYYAFKFCNDFEEGILTAVNSAGNNMARSALTGALLGAMVGIKGIPEELITGLKNDPKLIPDEFKGNQSEYLMSLVDEIVKKNVPAQSGDVHAPTSDDGGSSGCNAGFAGMLLLLALPAAFYIAKRKD